MAGLQTDATAPLAAISGIEAAHSGKHDSFDEKHQGENSSLGHGAKVELDGIHDGLIFPTDEERATLRRVPDSVPWNAYRTPSHLMS